MYTICKCSWVACVLQEPSNTLHLSQTNCRTTIKFQITQTKEKLCAAVDIPEEDVVIFEPKVI